MKLISIYQIAAIVQNAIFSTRLHLFFIKLPRKIVLLFFNKRLIHRHCLPEMREIDRHVPRRSAIDGKRRKYVKKK